LAGGGTITGGGRLRPAGDRTVYDVDVVTRAFNPSAVSTKAPESNLNGRIVAAGSGLDPATMRASVALNLDASSLEGAAIDSAVGRLTVADGLATVPQLQVRGQGLVADLRGTFGLRRDRTGEIAFTVQAPSIAPFGRYIPGGDAPGAVTPRPGVVARRVAQASADSARVARETEVERAVTGRALPPMAVDTPRAIPRSAVSGSLLAAGTLRGNIHQFDAQGRVAGENLVVRGHTAGSVRGEFAWVNALTPGSQLSAALSGRSLVVGGFALDSADARVGYAAPSGRVAVALWQGPDNDYAVNGEFTLSRDRNSLVARGVALRFDETLYTAPNAFTVRWGGPGLEVDNLDLVSNRGGRIYADGRLPIDGPGNLAFAITDFEVGDVLQLLQSDVNLRGLVTAEGTMRGTMAAPRFDGAAGVVGATLNGTRVPDLRGRFTYADRVLTSRLEAIQESGAVLAAVDASIPANLALSGVTGPRFSDQGMVVDVVADSLPLTLISEFVDAVSDVSGVAAGRFSIRGSLSRPQITGVLALANASAKIDPLGITVRDIAGLVRMAGDTVVIDSLVGRSKGELRLRGGLGIGNWREPAFDLYLVADDARVLDNDLGELHVSTGLALRGPFNAAYLSGQATIEHGVLFAPSGSQKRLISNNDPAIRAVLDTTLRSDLALLPTMSSSLLSNLRADVDIVVNRNTWVRSREVNIEIFTEVPVAAHLENDEFALTGIVSTDRGEYELFGKRFEVNRGSALFIGSPDINPTVQLTAQYEVRLPARPAINININVGGTLKQPRITLESDAQPPIPQTELRSLLAFGT
ncbi:MAG: translocation/assembly module TamB domain-containing protein, partial [Gemmatimonadaceae bacterium]|nr:translocation/assembly module TamB domain-containing protein [Gemmatimonadaceae bacterium]